jgi:F-type H+-transporting ATPase subunit epsilon
LKDQQAKIDYARAQAELLEAVAQLQTIEQMKRLKNRVGGT